MLEQQCPAKVLTTQNQNRWSWSVDSRLAQHWTFLLCDNDDEQRATDSRCLYSRNAGFTPRTLVFTPHDFQGPRQPTNCLATSPSYPAWTPTEACMDVLSQGNRQDQRILQYCPSKTYQREASGLSLYLSVCLIEQPPYHNCTPRDCSERLPFWWTSSFF